MPSTRQIAGQVALYAAFFLPLAYLTSAPAYQAQAPELATLKLAVRHAGEIVGECTAVSGPAYDKMQENMRRPQLCPRERSPLRLLVKLDDATLLDQTFAASGLHSDGVASVYRRFTVPAGRYQLAVFMNDDVSLANNTWELREEVELQPAAVVVVSFKDGFTVE